MDAYLCQTRSFPKFMPQMPFRLTVSIYSESDNYNTVKCLAFLSFSSSAVRSVFQTLSSAISRFSAALHLPSAALTSSVSLSIVFSSSFIRWPYLSTYSTTASPPSLSPSSASSSRHVVAHGELGAAYPKFVLAPPQKKTTNTILTAIILRYAPNKKNPLPFPYSLHVWRNNYKVCDCAYSKSGAAHPIHELNWTELNWTEFIKHTCSWRAEYMNAAWTPRSPISFVLLRCVFLQSLFSLLFQVFCPLYTPWTDFIRCLFRVSKAEGAIK